MGVLVSGCSFTGTENQSTHWTSMLFGGVNVMNMAKGGAGNRYIASSVLSNIDLGNKPQYVFILWSGIRRIDIPFQLNASTQLYKEHPCYNKCHEVEYYFTGGNKGIVTPYVDYQLHGFDSIEEYRDERSISIDDNSTVSSVIQRIENEFYRGSNGQLGIEQSDMMCNQLSMESISSVTNFLDNHGIIYDFSFIYDPFSKYINHQPSLGMINKESPYYNHINWDNYIGNTPFEYGLKYDLLSDDGFHLTDDGMNQWAKFIQSKIRFHN